MIALQCNATAAAASSSWPRSVRNSTSSTSAAKLSHCGRPHLKSYLEKEQLCRFYEQFSPFPTIFKLPFSKQPNRLLRLPFSPVPARLTKLTWLNFRFNLIALLACQSLAKLLDFDNFTITLCYILSRLSSQQGNRHQPLPLACHHHQQMYVNARSVCWLWLSESPVPRFRVLSLSLVIFSTVLVSAHFYTPEYSAHH